MRRSPSPQSATECSNGLTFYRCRTNHYAGCCSVDPCELPGCPDDRDRVTGEEGSTAGGNEGDTPVDGEDGEEGGGKGHKEKPTFTRTAIPTTIASKAPPLQPSPTENHSIPAAATTKNIGAPGKEAPTTRAAVEPVPTLAPDNSIAPEPTLATGISAPTKTTDAEDGGDGGLSTAAKGGIFGAMGAVMLIVIVAFFLCGKRGRKLRKSLTAGGTSSDDDPLDGKGGLQPFGTPPTGMIQELKNNGILAPFGDHYEEPHSRFTRACAYNRSHRMKNDPLSPVSLESPTTMDLEPQPSFVEPSRPRSATPEFSRTDASTPELQGSPKRAAFAELVSPGLPKLVQIPMNRQSMQRYKAYRPSEQMHPLCEGSSASLRGDLSATPDERHQNRYVNSWSRWDAAAGH